MDWKRGHVIHCHNEIAVIILVAVAKVEDLWFFAATRVQPAICEQEQH